MGHLLVDHLGHGASSCNARRARLFLDGTIRVYGCAVDEELPGFLRQRHLAQQILDAGCDGLARVFVDVQTAVLVEVTKGESVF